MGEFELPGDPPVSVSLRRSGRARRISLRVSDLDGRVTLTVPRRGHEAEARAFAESKADWIRAALSRRKPIELPRAGATLPIEGRAHALVARPGRSAEIADGTVFVPDAPERVGPALEAALKARARARLHALVPGLARDIGRNVGRITLRDTRSRWGSCSSRGDLMFSWRLILAPRLVLAYVAAHEVAHLAEMNHSPAYWRVVHDLMPDYAEPRAWLRKNGASLHRFRFKN